MEGIERLNISWCKLATIPPTSLTSLYRLKTLNITTHNADWGSLALGIETKSLPPSLEQLNLQHNNIWNVPKYFFCKIYNLVRLDLSYNRLQDVEVLRFWNQVYSGDEDKFYDSTNDENVTSANIKLKLLPEITSAKESKSCGRALQELILSHNEFIHLPPGGFSVLSGLRKLILNDNDIRAISNEAFIGLDSLLVLDLSNNHIMTIENGTFITNILLERLYLKNNSLDSINNELFSNLHELQFLDLSWNKLELAENFEDIFSELWRLVILDLSHNRLKSVVQSLFKGLTSLQKLDLSHNQIKTLEEGSLYHMSNLYELELSHNQLLSLGEESFTGLLGLSLLDLTNNTLVDLHPNIFKHSSNLKEIYLKENNFQSIPNALENLSFLKVLDISKNFIEAFEPFVFRDVGNLVLLNISYNILTSLQETSLRGLTSLRVFDVSNNDIIEIKQEAFSKASNIKLLNFSSNRLSDINGYFSAMEKLEFLDLSGNNIKMFDYSFLPRQLLKLNIENNKIKRLGNYYKVHNVLYLKEIKASFNHLHTLNDISLPNTLARVILDNNNISDVKPSTFKDKTNLEYLDLRNNNITKINPKSITPKLGTEHSVHNPKLLLGGNPLRCDCEMEWLYSASRMLDISVITDTNYMQPQIIDTPDVKCQLPHYRGNSTNVIRVADTTPQNFLCPYATHCFALCQCCKFIACDCQMQCPKSCSCFHDDTWSMNLVDCSRGDLNRLPDKVPMDATVVFLDGNNLKVLHAHHFIGRHSIQHLFLNNSNIQTLHNRTFHGLTSLRVLHLHDNMIVKLNGFEFSDLSHLKELYLHNNRLSFINNTTFTGLKSLEVLFLHNNFLIDFQVWSLRKNKVLTSISLANNPWDCNCKFVQSFRKWIKEHEMLNLRSEKILCTFDSSGTPGPNIILPEYNCMNDGRSVTRYHFPQEQLPFLAGGLCGGVALITTLIVAAMFFSRRKSVTAHKLGFSNSSSFSHDDDGKVFDAYLSYSAKDASYVRDVIAIKLENSAPSYKLCLHSRDFTETTRLSEFITQSVSFSRRTIIVLSKNYIDSEWKNSIFKKAHLDSLKDKDSDIIVINFDGVHETSFDYDLKTLLKKSTRLRWGDKTFWKRLAEALPPKPMYSGLSVYISDPLYKAPVPILPPNQDNSILPSSSSVLTTTTGMTTPSEPGRRTSAFLSDGPTTYKAPPPPRPCYSPPPPSCDYIVMAGKDCKDLSCSCRSPQHSTYAYVDGDSVSSVHTYNSLEVLAHEIVSQPNDRSSHYNQETPHYNIHGSNTMNNPHRQSRPINQYSDYESTQQYDKTNGVLHSPTSQQYNISDVPNRKSVRSSKRKKQQSSGNMNEIIDIQRPSASLEALDMPDDLNQDMNSFRRSKSGTLRVSQRSVTLYNDSKSATSRPNEHSLSHQMRQSSRSRDSNVWTKSKDISSLRSSGRVKDTPDVDERSLERSLISENMQTSENQSSALQQLPGLSTDECFV